MHVLSLLYFAPETIPREKKISIQKEHEEPAMCEPPRKIGVPTKYTITKIDFTP